MISIDDNKNCCGCSACVQKCPKHCISMVDDGEGFLYPCVDRTLCVDCGLCETVCPVINKGETYEVASAFAAYANSDDVRASSSSGGIFRLLAEYVLSLDGLVYGVAMSADCRMAKFIRVSELQNLAMLQGSKYLQASVGDTYQKVKTDLDDDRYVLFSGTGCQVNGLRNYLGKEYPNLFCVDVLCHGTPSPALWEQYVDYIEAENQAKLIGINFRCKDKSWSDLGVKTGSDNEKQVFSPKDTDPYMQMFLRNYCLRPSCYKCVAKQVKRSDMTIADFWGIHDVAPEMNDGKGVSLVLVRTAKGMDLFEKIKKQIRYKGVSYEDGVRCNPVEYRSVNRPKERDIFFGDMNTLTFEQLMAKYAAPIPETFKTKVKKSAKKMLRMTNQKKGVTCEKNYGLLFEMLFLAGIDE